MCAFVRVCGKARDWWCDECVVFRVGLAPSAMCGVYVGVCVCLRVLVCVTFCVSVHGSVIASSVRS